MSDCQTILDPPDVSVSGTINAPIDQVWATVGDFNAFPVILPQIWDYSTVDGSGVGTIRTLSNNAGEDIIEQLEAVDAEGEIRSIEFTILGGSFTELLPVDSSTYYGTIQLEDTGNGQTLFTWSASYDLKAGASEEDASILFEGIFNSALEGLRTIHEPQPIDCAAPDIDLQPIENPDASISVVIDAPADAVWATVGNFDALPHYLPSLWDESVVEGSGVGAVRTLTNAEGALIVEELVEYDGVGEVRSLKFTIEESENFPLPFDTDSYLAFMQVEELNEQQCLFTWSASYEPTIDPDEAEAALEGLFNLAADNLKLIHEDPDSCTGCGGQGCGLEACDDFSQEDWGTSNDSGVLFPRDVCEGLADIQPIVPEDGYGLADTSLVCGGITDSNSQVPGDPFCAEPPPLEVSCGHYCYQSSTLVM